MQTPNFFQFIEIILLLTFITKTNCQIPLCLQQAVDDTNYLEQLWSTLSLQQTDRLLFIILSPLLLIIQIIVVVMFIKHPKLLQKPGNIFFTMVLIQIGINLHLLSSAIYYMIYTNSQIPSNFSTACQVLGFLQTLFQINHASYLFIFLYYAIFLMRFSLKKKNSTFWLLLHISSFFFCLCFTIFFFFQDFVGLTFYGFCGMTTLFRNNSSRKWYIIVPAFQISINLAFLAVGIFSYEYYKKHMPQGQLKFRKDQYKKLVFLFVIGFSIFELSLSILSLVLALNCSYSDSLQAFRIFVTISNITRFLQYFFTIFLIIWTDRFRKKLKFMGKRVFMLKSSSQRNISNIRRNFQMQQIIVNQKLLQLKDKSDQFDLLFASQIYTIISGIYAMLYEYFQHNLHEDFNKQVKPINFKQSITIEIDKQTIKNYQFQTRIMLKLQILKCRLIFYAPKVFLSMLQSDGLFNIHESFKIMENVQKIWNLTDGQGGKSGEFFFFTADLKYVLKTITDQQFTFLKNNLHNFYEHYKNNPESLLAKIYGLFIIKGDQIQRTYRLILMKNIIACPKSQIMRVYDLKGSKYNRQVVRSQMQLNEYVNITLKDVDFMKFQGKLKIKLQKSEQLRNTITKDAQFLRQLNLIDYSFLVVKVKWQISPTNPNFWGPLQRIAHSQNHKQYYHIGIIDYLQLWDFQKRSQSWWKKITGKTDISAVNPRSYCIRFLGFIQDISCNLDEKKRVSLLRYIKNLRQYKELQKEQQLQKYAQQINGLQQIQQEKSTL